MNLFPNEWPIKSSIVGHSIEDEISSSSTHSNSQKYSDCLIAQSIGISSFLFRRKALDIR